MKQEIILGIHSIIEAIKNNQRESHRLFATPEGLKKLRSEFNDLGKFINENKFQVINNKHEFQKVAAKNFEELGFKASRVMNGVFLLSSPKSLCKLEKFLTK